jgi:hypothetical protein
MSDKSASGDTNNESDNESIKPISEDEGLKSAESIFKAEENKAEDSSLDEDKEFLKYLKLRKKAKDLGLDDPRFTTFHYQGGIHLTNSNLENHGNMAGDDQTIHSSLDTGGFSGEARHKLPDKEGIESIEAVFDRCEDVKQRSFMISLSALNGCNYRTVIESSQRLQSILQSYIEFQAEVDTEE